MLRAIFAHLWKQHKTYTPHKRCHGHGLAMGKLGQAALFESAAPPPRITWGQPMARHCKNATTKMRCLFRRRDAREMKQARGASPTCTHKTNVFDCTPRQRKTTRAASPQSRRQEGAHARQGNRVGLNVWILPATVAAFEHLSLLAVTAAHCSRVELEAGPRARGLCGDASKATGWEAGGVFGDSPGSGSDGGPNLTFKA